MLQTSQIKRQNDEEAVKGWYSGTIDGPYIVNPVNLVSPLRPVKKMGHTTDPANTSTQTVTVTTAVNKVDFAVDKATDEDAGNAVDPIREDTELQCDVVINELLSYVGFYRNGSKVEALRGAIISFYSPGDVSLAKRALVQKYHCERGSAKQC